MECSLHSTSLYSAPERRQEKGGRQRSETPLGGVSSGPDKLLCPDGSPWVGCVKTGGEAGEWVWLGLDRSLGTVQWESLGRGEKKDRMHAAYRLSYREVMLVT